LSLSSTEISSLYLAATLLAAAPLTYLGGLTDRWGLYRSAIVAVLGIATACAVAASVQHVAALLVAFWLMRMIGSGTLTLIANNTLAHWFHRRLGMASSAMQLGMAGAIAFAPGLMLALIGMVGWREAYWLLAALLACVLAPLIAFTYREPSDNGGSKAVGGLKARNDAAPETHDATLGEAMRTAPFWVLHATIGAWALIGTALMFHLEAVFHSRGATAAQSAWATTVMAVGVASLQLSGGILADRLGVRPLLAAAMTAIAGGCLTIGLSQGAVSLLAGYAFYGAGQGMMTIVASVGWPRYFGRSHLGRIRGTATTSAVACSSMGPLALGASIDHGGIETAFWGFAATAFVLAVISGYVLAPHTPRH
ncbi:MAG: MFS transporter, partial [Planctomycetales bacterium]|nr:MFS transporter [Planctomycetales bacterium]